MQSSQTQVADVFRAFSGEHLLAMATIFFVALALACLPRLARMGAGRRRIGIAMSVLLAINELVWFIYTVGVLKVPLREMLPVHLCDVSMMAVIIGLAWPRQALFEFAYFFGIGGALQAIITPDLAEGFPSYPALKFFVSHGGIFAGVAFLMGALGYRPYPRSVVRAICFGFAYLGIAGSVNWLLGTNYGYLASKPTAGSLLDYLGPWPWYIGSMVGLSALIILFLYSPFLLLDHMRKSRDSANKAEP